MLEEKSKEIEKIRARWDERAGSYDEYYKNFKGAVEHYLDLELLKKYLPKNKNVKILDAAGGTGRITLALARMGYAVTLCDISPKMLEVAKKKMLKAGVSDNVTVLECDVCNMPFPDKSFDFVLSYGGGIKAVKELVRVTKKKGKISMCLVNRYGTAINKFRQDPKQALALLTSKSEYDCYEDEKYRTFNEKEASRFLEKEGFKIIALYAYDIWNSLSIPQKILDSGDWDKNFLRQTVEIMLRLAKEPSVRGISRHWVVYGERM
jgi:ubiquinone/menaquinone biosynthesis C-methylase UbiE